jgi:hypothetical protein
VAGLLVYRVYIVICVTGLLVYRLYIVISVTGLLVYGLCIPCTLLILLLETFDNCLEVPKHVDFFTDNMCFCTEQCFGVVFIVLAEQIQTRATLIPVSAPTFTTASSEPVRR